jgi:hypothetical protein
MYVHLYGRLLSIFLQLKGISFQGSMENPLPWDLRRLGGFCARGNGPIPIQVFCTCCLAEFHGCCTMKKHLEIKLIYVMCIIYIYVYDGHRYEDVWFWFLEGSPLFFLAHLEFWESFQELWWWSTNNSSLFLEILVDLRHWKTAQVHWSWILATDLALLLWTLIPLGR